MSDALNYLVKARPDAMGHYFKFLKEAGRHLDPKTRNLISVITKVHAQTDRGFRQYLTRALREGCTPAEVIDALLMAFPALGLAKIVWAVDVLLDMDLPEFQPDAMGLPGTWHDVMAIDELAVGAVTRVDCDGRGLFVHRGADEIRVYDSRCPHQTTNIPHLALQGTKLTCPKHEWQFDITTGECIAKGDRPLRRWKSKLENGRLLAYW
ncbi:MAG: Rieske 2Fe-2S domain-containing protein [Burkholderiales bacterium]|jgi:nitrite reductase/ring-hydroxylating ferredoxin subunit/alkylhydroperoxidase/carboxymuconolactone decarboxylase family protein YurZ|nr:MAG: Rieske 2Fe-2S domain-containing protein [Burkholderiales bacterium]